MLNAKKALSSFSVDDIQKAKDFYGNALGLGVSAGPEGTVILSEAKTLILRCRLAKTRWAGY